MVRWIRRTALGLAAVTLLAGLTACGHHRHHAGWSATPEERAKHREHIVGKVASRLDLDAEQKRKLDVLATKLAEQRLALHGGRLHDPREDMKALVAGAKFDRTKAQALVTEKTAAVQAKGPEVIAALADFYDSLNPEQQAKVRAFLERRHGWRRS